MLANFEGYFALASRGSGYNLRVAAKSEALG